MKETHYLDIRVAIDYRELLSPERIEGVKTILGVATNEDIIEAHAQIVVDKLTSQISKRVEIAKIEAQVNKILINDKLEDKLENHLMEKMPQSDQAEIDKRMEATIIRLDEELEEDNKSNNTIDLFDMLDEIGNGIFEINAMLGAVNQIRIKSEKFTAAEIALNLGVDENIVETGVLELEQKFEINYVDIDNNNKKILGGN